MFEFIGECFNPGGIGTVEKCKVNREHIKLSTLIFKTMICIGIIVLCFMYFVKTLLPIQNTLLFLLGMTIYCVIAFLFVPKPDYSNVGWLGGLIDHPFRISDDINRVMLFFLIALYPGRLISRTFLTWVYYFFIAE